MEPWPEYPFWNILSNAGEGWKVERPSTGHSSLKMAINPKENLNEVRNHFELTSRKKRGSEKVVGLTIF
jgi:hypothetical protein